MKTIVALIDFSDVTFKLLKEVHAVAKAFGSRVLLLHVASKQPVVVDVGLMAPTVAEAPSAEMMREEEGRMLELQESLNPLLLVPEELDGDREPDCRSPAADAPPPPP